jgi:hypothetical protein
VNEEGDKYDRINREKCRVLKEKALEYFRIHGFGDWPSDTPLDEQAMKPFAIFFDQVIEFFRSSKGAGFFHRPGGFKVMLNAYAQWVTGLSESTISDYRGKLRKVQRPVSKDLRFLQPETSNRICRYNDPSSDRLIESVPQGVNYYHTSELDDSFHLPTVRCSLPKCHHHEHPRYGK